MTSRYILKKLDRFAYRPSLLVHPLLQDCSPAFPWKAQSSLNAKMLTRSSTANLFPLWISSPAKSQLQKQLPLCMKWWKLQRRLTRLAFLSKRMFLVEWVTSMPRNQPTPQAAHTISTKEHSSSSNSHPQSQLSHRQQQRRQHQQQGTRRCSMLININ